MSASGIDITISDDYIITTSKIPIEPTESLGKYMFKNMKKYEHEIAQIITKTGRRDAFGQLLQRCIRTALHMSDKKISREDVVSVCSTNHSNAIVPYIAAQFLGAVTANMDPFLSPERMKILLNLSRPKIIFASLESVPVLEEVLRDVSLQAEIVVFGGCSKHVEFSDFLKIHPDEDEFEPIEIENLEDTACIYFSSGTTGVPKAILLSHYGIVGCVENWNFVDDFDGNRRNPLTLFFHSTMYWTSFGVTLLQCMRYGMCRLVCEDFDIKEMWNLIDKYKPNILILLPAHAIEMAASRRSDVDVTYVIYIGTVAYSISQDNLLRIQEVFSEATIGTAYGMAETYAPILMFQLNKESNESEKIVPIGQSIRETSYKVVDIDTGKSLGPNQRGELRIKSKFCMSGYLNVNTSNVVDENGWFKTGDMVYFDENFSFYFVDRISDNLKYRKWTIAPSTIENVLSKHPAVKQAFVIGIPEDDGDHLMGLVVLHDAPQVSEKEIEKFVECRVPENERLIAGVKFIKFVPRTVTGKVNKTELKRLVLEGKL